MARGDATGLVATIYEQMADEFAIVPPLTIHSVVPDILAGVWCLSREAFVVGPGGRVRREMVAAAVSRSNACPYCVEVHSAMLHATQDHEVLIETTAIGVNFPDIRERLGIYNQKDTRVGGVQLPQVGGIGTVGHVVAVGADADGGLRGKKVVAIMKKGGYAQFAVAQEGFIAELDATADDFRMAGIAGQGVTAYLMLQASAKLRAGESLLVHGAAGGVGSIAVQIAKTLGAGTVIGTASSEERREFVRGLGADFAIGYDNPDWIDAVLEHTGGRGVDVLIELIGGEVFEQNFQALATFGRYILLGSTQGPGQPFAARRLMTKAQTLTGIYLPVFFERAELISEALRFLAEGVRSGKLGSNVDTIFPLSDAAKAHRALEERRAKGVVVLDPKH